MMVAELDDEALQIDSTRPVLPSDEVTEMEVEMKRVALEQAKRGAKGEG